MSIELVRAQPLASNLPDMVRYAEHLADANLLPAQYRQRPANVLYAMEYGRTLGITPLAAITGIHVIEGKPSASAALISGLVRQAGHKLRVRGNSQSATAQIIRSDDPDFTYEVTWELRRSNSGNPSAEDAKLLNKDVWQKYPAAMLKARAISQVARDACEEVLFGLHYTPEELDARVDADGLPLDAQVQQLRRVDNTAPDPWNTPGATPTEQQHADDAKAATSPDAIRGLYRTAKDAGLLTATVQTPDGTQELGAYLVARGQQLAGPQPAEGQGATNDTGDETPDGEVLEGEVVADTDDNHAAAVSEFRAFATAHDIANADTEAEAALGLPLDEASAASIRDLIAQLRGNAA
jgi:hypothetical protein